MFNRQGIHANNYLSLEEGDIANREITLKTEAGDVAKFYFNYEDAFNCIKEALDKPYLLTPSDNQFFINMYNEVPIPQELIGSILVHVALSKEGAGYHIAFNESDYKAPNVVRFRKKRPHNMYLREFVCAPDAAPERLFFAVAFRLEDLTVTCVEVHPTEWQAIKLCFFHVDQLELGEWHGPEIPSKKMREIFNDPEAFEALIAEIPVAEGRWIPEDDY